MAKNNKGQLLLRNVKSAQRAFWEVIFKKYPNQKASPITTDNKFNRACEEVVDLWLSKCGVIHKYNAKGICEKCGCSEEFVTHMRIGCKKEDA